MTLENITGDLLVYNKLESGTMLCADRITTERRRNHGLRDQYFYTADGNIYTVQKKTYLWAITREPQNLVLNINDAHLQLRDQGNYFPDSTTAQASLEHGDTVVIDVKGLVLAKNNKECGCFVVNPRDVKKLNSEQRRAAQRIYGPDEENFGLNMEMFAEAGMIPYVFVFVLLPDYVQDTLRSNDQEFLARASWLNDFSNNSHFDAIVHNVDYYLTLRGARRVVAKGDALKDKVSSVLTENRYSYDERNFGLLWVTR